MLVFLAMDFDLFFFGTYRGDDDEPLGHLPFLFLEVFFDFSMNEVNDNDEMKVYMNLYDWHKIDAGWKWW